MTLSPPRSSSPLASAAPSFSILGGIPITYRLTLHLLSLALSTLYYYLVQSQVPLPYLDEIFHIPQTQAYCVGDWARWDEAITTPPGLYVLPAAIARVLAWLGKVLSGGSGGKGGLAATTLWDAERRMCSIVGLRAWNFGLGVVAIPALISAILDELRVDGDSAFSLQSDEAATAITVPAKRLRSDSRTSPAMRTVTTGKRSKRNAFFHLVAPRAEAVVIAQFPLIAFFSNLYYTDLASLAGVLAAWALASRGKHGLAALVGAWSITVRQTNVIWLGFVAGVAILRLAEQEVRRPHQSSQAGRATMTPSPSKGNDAQLARFERTDPLLELWTQGFGTVPRLAQQLAQRPWRFAAILAPYVPVFLGFGLFLKWNGGIVLGHKELHKPVLHIPQLFYFVAFSTVMLLPALFAEGPVSTVRSVIRMLGSSWIVLGLVGPAWAGMVFLIKQYEMWHPFLLADNRHYLFYVLRRLILPYRKAWHILSPGIYVVCLTLWTWRLRRHFTVFWTMGFLACTALTLIPTPLVEPRYFLIPTVILRVQLAGADTPQQGQRRARLWAEWCWYALFNAATLGLFLGKKFKWEGWDGWMRIMW